MRYLPWSPLLPSPTHTSPPFFAQLGTVLLSCSALPLSLLPTADSHSCCPCLADGLPQPALLLLLLPNCYQSLSLFYCFVLLPPATSPFLCKWTAPICLLLPPATGHFSLPHSADGLPRSALLIILILLVLQMGCPLFWPYTLSTY